MTPPALTPQPFGATPDGLPTQVFTLENDLLRTQITDFGGRMVSVEAPDRDGRRAHVLLGFDSAHDFATASGKFGTLLGRYANRIDRGVIEIDGEIYELATQDGVTTHGGPVNFSNAVWQVIEAASAPVPTLVLRHVSPDGDQGFPGELTATATYRLEGDTLSLDLQATTTRPTVVNLSVHPYFNLAGAASGDCLAQIATIHAEAFLPTDKRQIPTGEIRPVEGTPFDFRQPHSFGERIRQPYEQIVIAGGYDHCWVLGRQPAAQPMLALHVHCPNSGRVLEVYTDQPGLQVYTANKLIGFAVGREGVTYRQAAGFAVEPQNFPDAPRQPGFPSAVLRPGETYSRTCRYRFATG
jgi:aldose 1-epimerase